MIGQAPGREQDSGDAVKDPLDPIPADVERLVAQILAFEAQQIEHDQHWRRYRAEPGVAIQCRFAVKDECLGPEVRDSLGFLREAGGQVLGVLGVPTDRADLPAVFVGQDSPTVNLLFVDPALAVEGLGCLSRLHGCHRERGRGAGRH